jgi:diguanylate cyclase (GGDEF)-like protein
MLWDRFIPWTPPTEALLRRSRLLTLLLIALLGLLFAALILTLTVNDEHDLRRGLYVTLILVGMCALLLALGLNRLERYSAAARLAVACAITGPWASILLDPRVLSGDVTPLFNVAVSVILSAILLSTRATVAIATLQVLALALVVFSHPALASVNWPSLFAFVFFASALSVISSAVNRKDLEQIERQAQKLIEDEAQMRQISIHDELTGLFNRRHMLAVLEREIAEAASARHSLGLIMVDVDYLKRVNDTYGHRAGDALLFQLGDEMQQHAGGLGITCRYGGDEFIIILPKASREITTDIAKRICEGAAQVRVQHEGQDLGKVSLSLGIAIYPTHGSTGTTLLGAVDDATYHAKHTGRGRVVVAGDQSC